MNITISVEELQKKKLFVGVPMYGGMCTGLFTKSMVDLGHKCAHYGIELRQYYLFNESLIQRARNYIAHAFMKSDSTHLMFIDADIGFNPDDVLGMLALQSDESEYDILCGPYPKKNISWEKIKHAVDKGAGDKNPEELAKYVGDYVFNMPTASKNMTLQEFISAPVEVLESGTGFMMIRRNTFETFKIAYPEQEYTPDHIRSDDFNGSENIMAYFDTLIDPKTKRYLSEDYMFCQWARKAGLKTYLCPWMELKHVGTYIFGGTLGDVLSIGASMTADEKLIKK